MASGRSSIVCFPSTMPPQLGVISPTVNFSERSSSVIDRIYLRFWPFSDLRLKSLTPALRTPLYPYVALPGPTYRENSHANHTWDSPSRQSACFSAPEAPPVWVRFPSPAPLQDYVLPCPRLDGLRAECVS